MEHVQVFVLLHAVLRVQAHVAEVAQQDAQVAQTAVAAVQVIAVAVVPMPAHLPAQQDAVVDVQGVRAVAHLTVHHHAREYVHRVQGVAPRRVLVAMIPAKDVGTHAKDVVTVQGTAPLRVWGTAVRVAQTVVAVVALVVAVDVLAQVVAVVVTNVQRLAKVVAQAHVRVVALTSVLDAVVVADV